MKKIIFTLIIITVLPMLMKSQQINYGEYYIDNDPGVGNGIAFNFIAGDSVIILDSILAITLPNGVHSLCIRVVNDGFEWSFSECLIYCKYLDTLQTVEKDVSSRIFGFEYYYGEDPGVGNGEFRNLTAIDSIALSDSILLDGLNYGMRDFSIRFLDSLGRWSFPETIKFCRFADTVTTYEYETSENIIGYEYYFGDDPGAGFADYKAINNIDSLILIDSVEINAPNSGVHDFSIRFLDNVGRWSFTESLKFSKYTDTISTYEEEKSANIIGYEYYFGNDPGVGNGYFKQLINIDSLVLLDSIDIYTLNYGINDFSIRFLDSLGRWSFPESIKFSYYNNIIPQQAEPYSPPIISGEYFFGNDPGQGNGSPFFFEQADTLNILQSISANGLGNGDYFLTIRFKDSLNNWSFNETLPFTVASVPELLYPDYESTDVPLNPTLVWRPFTGASSYNVQLSNNANFTTTIINQNVSDTTLFVDSILNYDTHYYWRANCVIGGSASVWSSVFRFKTRRNVETPRLISPNNLSTQVATTPKFVWSKSDSSLTYNLLVSTSPSFDTTVINETGIIDTLFESTILQSFTTYYWKILGVGDNNTSYWSTTWQFTTGDSSGFIGTPKVLQVQLAMHGLWDGQSHKKAPLQVELRQGDSLMNSTVIVRKSAIINEEGIIEINFAEIDTGDYWLIVRSGGYLSLGSTSKVNISTNGFFYDFSDNPYKSAGGIYAVIQSGDGKWCMRAGDFNADRKTNAAEDFEFYIKPNSGKNISNYVPEP